MTGIVHNDDGSFQITPAEPPDDEPEPEPRRDTMSAADRHLIEQAKAGAALFWAMCHAPADYFTGALFGPDAPDGLYRAYAAAQAAFAPTGLPVADQPPD